MDEDEKWDQMLHACEKMEGILTAITSDARKEEEGEARQKKNGDAPLPVEHYPSTSARSEEPPEALPSSKLLSDEIIGDSITN